MSYILCPHCGQKALSVATRCPHCGRGFDRRPWQFEGVGTRRRRIPVGWIVGAVAVAVVVLSVVQREYQVAVKAPSAPPPVATVEPSPPPPAAAPIEAPPPSAVSSDTAPTPAVEPAPAPLVSGPLERRYASTWVNVRTSRSPAAPVVLVLKPRETVMVDSLRQGWYRAVADGRTLGYVDRSLVGTAPESVPP
jgi:hypothetical protein